MYNMSNKCMICQMYDMSNVYVFLANTFTTRPLLVRLADQWSNEWNFSST